jgi:hypothetical protein
MSGYGDKPFGLNDVKLTNIGGTTQVDLPSARVLKFSERMKSGELSGDDMLVAVASFAEAVEWELEAGGITLEAYALLTGRTVSTSGTTPNRTTSLHGHGAECFPYIKIYGKALSECTGDIHAKIFKAKVTKLEGSLQEGEFFVTSCSGIAIDDGTNGMWEFIQNETAATLPAT